MENLAVRQTLKVKGYKESYLNLVSNPEFSHVRFTLEELLFMEGQVGKEVVIETTYANTVKIETFFINKFDPAVVGASVFNKNNQVRTCINKKSIQDLMKSGKLTIDSSSWNLGDGCLTFAKKVS